MRGQFGAVRFVWNKGLSIKRHYYRVKGKYLDPVHDLKKLIAVAKRHRKYAWLKAYDVMALQESLRHLGTAFSRFSKKEAEYPRFKRRRGEQSSYHCTGVSVGSDFINDNVLRYPKNNVVPRLQPQAFFNNLVSRQ